jgi:MFS-type transporter involved in bile tolerance (Atg22 family)
MVVDFMDNEWLNWTIYIFRYSTKAESIDELITSTVAGIISNIVAVPLALITIKVIKDYSEVEPLLNKIRQDEEIITHSSVLN